jgi:hypothetical protein
VFGVSVFGVRNRIDSQIAGEKFEILKEKKETQFTANNNYLNIVIFRMKNPGIENNGEFSFELKNENDEVIREIKFRGMNVGDPSDMRFQFDPVENSKDKTYKIVLKPDDSKPTVSVEVSSDNKISYKSYFRTLNKGQAASSFIALLESKVKANSKFFIFWGLSLVLVIYYEMKNRKG